MIDLNAANVQAKEIELLTEKISLNIAKMRRYESNLHAVYLCPETAYYDHAIAEIINESSLLYKNLVYIASEIRIKANAVVEEECIATATAESAKRKESAAQTALKCEAEQKTASQTHNTANVKNTGNSAVYQDVMMSQTDENDSKAGVVNTSTSLISKFVSFVKSWF